MSSKTVPDEGFDRVQRGCGDGGKHVFQDRVHHVLAHTSDAQNGKRLMAMWSNGRDYNIAV